MTLKNFSTQKILIHLPIFILLFTISFSSFSQEKFDLRESTSKHEISIGVADLMSKDQAYPYYPYYGYDMLYYPYPYDYGYNNDSPKITLRYKYSIGNVALRFGTDFSYNSREDDTDQSSYQTETSNLYTLNKLGLEWQHDFRRAQFYFGADIFSQYSLYKYTYKNYYNITDVNGNYVEVQDKNKTKNTSNSYGFSPFVGIKVFLNENISIGVETNYMFGNYEDNYNNEYYQNGSFMNESESSNEGTFAKFGQIGLISLNIHF